MVEVLSIYLIWFLQQSSRNISVSILYIEKLIWQPSQKKKQKTFSCFLWEKNKTFYYIEGAQKKQIPQLSQKVFKKELNEKITKVDSLET